MSLLVVLCPHCLTWIEPHAGRCTECGVDVNVDDPDPRHDILQERLGNLLVHLGPVQLERAGWPRHGQLVATTEGLLYLPFFRSKPNGAIEHRVVENARASVPWLFRWWFRRHKDRSPSGTASSGQMLEVPTGIADDNVPEQSDLLEKLFDFPGGLFVQRTSILRLIPRWNTIRIERPPARSVTLKSISPDKSIHDLFRELSNQPTWREVLIGR